jgi:hypothetical protein
MRRFESARRLESPSLLGQGKPQYHLIALRLWPLLMVVALNGQASGSELTGCRGGGIGRRTGLKILRAERSVPVQVRPSVRVHE